MINLIALKVRQSIYINLIKPKAMKPLLDYLEKVKHLDAYLWIMFGLVVLVGVRLLVSYEVNEKKKTYDGMIDRAAIYQAISHDYVDSVKMFPGCDSEITWHNKAIKFQIMYNLCLDSAKNLN